MTFSFGPLFWGVAGLKLCIVGLVLLDISQDMRIDQLEDRITTFETVRIEYVAPPTDSGRRK